MDQPVQSQPQAKPQFEGQAVTSEQTKPLPTFSSKPKIALIAVGISAVLLIAILASFIVPSYLTKRKAPPSASPTPSTDFSKIPAENLGSANGEVVAVDPASKKISVRSLSPRVDGKYLTWTITVTPETILARFTDWEKASSGESTISAGFPKTDAEIKAQLARIRLDSFKTGDSVYLMAKQGQDLATMEEIEGPSALFLQ